jgi:two-component system nitrogen regulation response regulator GlnG
VSRILVVDDEASIRLVLRDALAGAGHDVEEAASADAARERLAAGRFGLAFVDIRMPGASGLELLDEIAASGPDAPVVVIMTAQNTFDNAIEAMKRGAFDYLTKPFDLKQIEAMVEKATRVRGLREEVSDLRRRAGAAFRIGEALVGTSAPMVETFKTIGRVAASEASVLILGESGTGKELVARAIHHNSRRSEGPFVAVNMSAIPTELIEAELFGHERGAFTGATEPRIGSFRQAQGGTLLLDEIGDVPLALQAKLLRVVQEREVKPLGARSALPIDVRILAATHQDLDKAVAEGRFREDLYFRLNVVPIRMAPLRERPEDVPLLVEHFVERFAHELGVSKRWPTAGVIERLRHHDWPGNVRELENVIKRALVLAAEDVITEEDIAGALQGTRALEDDWAQLARREFGELLEKPEREGSDGPYWELVARLERALISEALARSGGNQIRAARRLGINRNTLRKKMTELGIDTDGRDAGE